ncbi:MAG: serine--tRNA ligase [Clostridia bacterium]|nr:serine--tRNA ligase [Deltaproteobacteria bacterium]
MLDHRAFFSDFDSIIQRLGNRGIDGETIEALRKVAQKRRDAIHAVEAMRAEQNQANDDVRKLRESDPAGFNVARGKLKVLKEKIDASEEAQKHAETSLEEMILRLPNLPDASVPVGKDEHANRLERTVGEPAKFSFKALEHFEIAEKLGIVSFEQAAKVSGARFAVYRGNGARLERALTTFMLDLARERGFFEIAPPLLVRRESMVGSGQYPKFEGESFETLDREYALIPTSEVPLVNLHRDEILDESSLPIRYCAYTPCFRREAGSAGRDTRGLIRQHQFNKVEMVTFAAPEDSMAELEHITSGAEEVLKRLELPYRVMSLSTGDLGFASMKTYDIEVWLPGQNMYREISSCSNCGDFQARRAKIRYRASEKSKPAFIHTLNGSGIAVGRTFVALLENYQREDGSVRIPKALVPYFGAEEIRGA